MARLVAAASMPTPTPSASNCSETPKGVAVYADYDGHRTHASYDAHRRDVGAAGGSELQDANGRRASGGHALQARHLPNRNGGFSWTLDDRSGRLLQSIRRS